MTPRDATKLLENIAVMLRLNGANDFKAGAFERAARVIDNLDSSEWNEAVETRRLTDLDGIGKSVGAELVAVLDTGESPRLAALKDEVPSGLVTWLEISGLGPKTIYKIHKELSISELSELKQACADGSVAALSGMGAKSAAKILKSIEWMEQFDDRCRIDQAEKLAAPMEAHLAALPGVEQVSIAGSLRRRRESIGDIDFLVAAQPEAAPGILAAFVEHPLVVEVLGHGDTKASVRAQEGRQLDLRVVEPSQFGAALMYFTGSKDHNVAMRSRARERGLALNEYGIYKLDAEGNTNFEARAAAETETEIYAVLDLPWIAPERREDRGEVESPDLELLEVSDIKGILHAHSTWSDGAVSIEEMARACIERGYEYLGLTDHSRAAAYANGLTAKRVEAQWQEIDEVNQRLADEGVVFKVFKGIESDILGGGELDYSDDLLAGFEFIIASVHNALDMDAERMQARVEAAAQNPFTTLIGHPTGRLILKREESKVDLEQLVHCAAKAGNGIEINANPRRLDIDWRLGPAMKKANLITAICPDAHAPDHIDFVRYGVDTARKAGIDKQNVLNTKSLSEFSEWLTARRA